MLSQWGSDSTGGGIYTCCTFAISQYVHLCNVCMCVCIWLLVCVYCSFVIFEASYYYYQYVHTFFLQLFVVIEVYLQFNEKERATRKVMCVNGRMCVCAWLVPSA